MQMANITSRQDGYCSLCYLPGLKWCTSAKNAEVTGIGCMYEYKVHAAGTSSMVCMCYCVEWPKKSWHKELKCTVLGVINVTQDQGFKYAQCPSVTIKCKSWTDCFQKDRKWKRLSLHHDMFPCATSSVLIPLWYRSSISGQRDPPIPVRRLY